MPTTSLALALSPHGRLLVDSHPDEESRIDSALAARMLDLIERGTGTVLFELGATEPATVLPAGLAFFRDLGRFYLTRLVGLPDLETTRERVQLSAPAEELAAFAARVPPITGAEYATPELLETLWAQTEAVFREEISEYDGTVESFLHGKHPLWNLVGRVCFHLAENKADPDRPFAFLATYSTGISKAGRVQHRPLGQALQEYSGANQKSALLALLLPVQRAAERSAFVRDLVDSGRVFHPLAWTPAEAFRFLQEMPAFEEAGVVVRAPDWWKHKAPPRVQVSVTVGGKAPSLLGMEALVDFKVQLALDGESLTAEEWRSLRAQASGLVRLRGRWVSLDKERLESLLSHWEKVKKAHGEGLSYLEAMRMLAGVPLEGGAAEALPETTDWSRIVAGPWLEKTLTGLRGPEGLARVHPGAALHADLRPYQEAGVRWLWFLNGLGLGACLADDMGLGKTIQVLSLFLLLKQKKIAKDPHLLVVPASLLANWQAEAARFAPSLKLVVAHPSAMTAVDALSANQLRDVDMVITTYGALHRYEWVSSMAWDTVVLDEAQAIKNAGSRQTRAAKTLKARVRLALTGTPVENRLADLWSLFDFVNPGLLGSAKAFGRYVKAISAHETGYQPLRELVRPYILRRLKTDKRVISDLPDKTEVRAFCPLTKRQVALYQEAVTDLAQSLGETEGIQRRGQILASLMRLKQICNHPSQWLGDNEYAAEQSGKFARLREIVEPIAARQEKMLVFTQFREMTEPLAAYLGELCGRAGLVLHGETPVKTRRSLVESFQNDDAVPFMVLSVKAGGTGLNLTAANHVVHFDRWWNPAVENQATDRAFRIGQKKNVLVHKLVCQGTVEEKIDALIESKRALSAELLDAGGEAILTELSDRELIRIVSLDIHRAQQES